MKGQSFATLGDLKGWPTEDVPVLACHPKFRYRVRADADNHIRELRDGARLGKKVIKPDSLNSFLCRFCGDYHVGHRQDAVALGVSANRGIVSL